VASTNGMRNLQEILVNDLGLGAELTGWTLTIAEGISDDECIIVGTGDNPSGDTEAWRADICESPVVGGELLPIETTSLLLAGTQSYSWMIPVVLSVLGIGLFVVSRKSENS